MYHPIQAAHVHSIHIMGFFVENWKGVKLKLIGKMQNIYGVKIVRPLPLQMLTTFSCLIKNLQNKNYLQNVSISGLCKKEPVLF